jgi:hypothetical protein
MVACARGSGGRVTGHGQCVWGLEEKGWFLVCGGVGA